MTESYAIWDKNSFSEGRLIDLASCFKIAGCEVNKQNILTRIETIMNFCFATLHY